MKRCPTAALVVAFAATLAGCAAAPADRAGLGKIEHIVVIYAENRSFDNLYGLFPGADGIANATPQQYTQVDFDGKPLAHLPPVWKGKDPDPAFPIDLPNKPFRIDAPPINMPLSVRTRDRLVYVLLRAAEHVRVEALVPVADRRPVRSRRLL